MTENQRTILIVIVLRIETIAATCTGFQIHLYDFWRKSMENGLGVRAGKPDAICWTSCSHRWARFLEELRMDRQRLASQS